MIAMFILFACEKEEQKLVLKGSWKMITSISNEAHPPPPQSIPIGMKFASDSIEYFRGFMSYVKDTIEGKRVLDYRGTWTKYEIKNDSIFVDNPFNKNSEFRYLVKKVSKDTLIFQRPDSSLFKLIRLAEQFESSIEFDQIVLSKTGCYGSCPIIDVSISKDGEVFFQGEGYVEKLGIYSSKIPKAQADDIFQKFYDADIINLNDYYAANHTDDESTITTFLKNGKIVKTIYDYGNKGPAELVWAYVPLQHLYTSIQLDTIPKESPYYPKMSYLSFLKDSIFLPLYKSESFYLWTELNNAKTTQENFEPSYTMEFNKNFTYWGPDPNDRVKKRKVKVFSNGRLFKFIDENNESLTYDLEYDFVKRNFSKKDFKKFIELDF